MTCQDFIGHEDQWSRSIISLTGDSITLGNRHFYLPISNVHVICIPMQTGLVTLLNSLLRFSVGTLVI